MKKKYLSVIISSFVLLLVIVNQAFPQTTGKIAGQVFDKQNKEPLAGANVFIEGANFGASTDLEGSFFILNLPPGTYTVSVQMIGYKAMQIENLRVSTNRTAYIDAGLNEALIEGEVIVVTADKFASSKDETSSMKSISSEEMDLLPVESVDDVIALQAGVVNGRVRGGRADEVTYLVDGVAVDESFGGVGSTVTIEKDAIADVELITGVMNAEYGKAMSGAVNTVIKDGGEKFDVTASVNTGTYVTSHTNIFLGLNEIDVLRNKDYKLSVSGPLLTDNLSFFFNTRYQDNKNHLNGIRRFNVNDYSDFVSDDPSFWISEANGDGEFVPMNDVKNLSLLGKLTYKYSSSLRTSLMYTGNDDEWNGYDHAWKYNPDGMGTARRESDMLKMQVNHMLNERTFYVLDLSYINAMYGYYLFEDPLSDKYVHDAYLRSAEHTGFLTGGQVKGHSKRVNEKYNAKFDITWQVNKHHSLKAGVVLTQYNIDNRDSQIQNVYRGTDLEEDTVMVDGKILYANYEPKVLGDTSAVSDIYKVDPYEFSGYLQDKMEYDDMVINLGIRMDYFDPNTVFPSDKRNPDNAIKNVPQSSYNKADKKIQICPRLGLSYQLGSRANLRFGYGHFFQMPPMYTMFTNHSFLVSPADYSTIMGNPQIKAQKTVQYEIGLKQELMTGLDFDVSLFYKDIYDLLSAAVISTYNQTEYGLFTNKDYGNVKGLELKFNYSVGNWMAKLNYTLQYTRGNADNPYQTFNRSGQNQDPVNRLIVMSWDQRHTLNTTFSYSDDDFGVTATAIYNSGTPYTWMPIATSSLVDINLPPNNDYSPAKFDVNMFAYYKLKIFDDNELKFELKVYNLLDRLNEYGINSNTGRANTAVIQESDLKSHKSNFNTYMDRIKNPAAYSAPRYIKFGVGITL